MIPLRCGQCGQQGYYRDGMRYCTGCAAAIAFPCDGCGRDALVGDRFCPFCARPLAGVVAPVAGAPQAAGTPGHTPGQPPPELPPGEIAALRALADEAQGRAAETNARPPAPTKRHLDQADIDAMFG